MYHQCRGLGKKYLITTGCSFTTSYSGRWKSWPYFFGKIVNREVINKGTTAVGNFYIVNKLYETIDTSKYNSDNSIVIVMWSGIDRVDIAVSKREFYYFDKQNIRDNWLHSGGKILFDNSKTKDISGLCHNHRKD